MVIGLSEYTLRVHRREQFFPTAKTGVIFNSIDLKDTPKRPEPPPVRDEVRLGYLGRVTQDKGIEVLLEACTKLPPTGWRLLVAGSGRDAYLAELQSRFALEQVDWLGFTAPKDLFARIDCLVVPSIWAEPFGRIVIEAAAFGVPVIVSDAGGIPEIMQLGLTGTIVPANDAAALAAALETVIRNRGRFDAPVADARWQTQLSEASIRDAYLACYAEVLSTGTR